MHKYIRTKSHKLIPALYEAISDSTSKISQKNIETDGYSQPDCNASLTRNAMTVASVTLPKARIVQATYDNARGVMVHKRFGWTSRDARQ